jgi:hypothetical protein
MSSARTVSPELVGAGPTPEEQTPVRGAKVNDDIGVVLIPDFPHQLLRDVFQADQPGCAAVLVYDEG